MTVVVFAQMLVATVQAQPTSPALPGRAASVQFPEPVFRPSLSAGLLTDAERQFLAAHRVVRVAISPEDFSPFQTIDGQGRAGGFSITGLTAIAASLGLTLEPVVARDWRHALELVRERQADLIPYLGYAEDRTSYLAFTRGIVRDPSVLIGTVGDRVVETVPQLKGVRVAVGRGYAAASLLARSYPDAVAVPVETIGEGLHAVSSGAARLYLGSMRPALHQIASSRIDELQIKGQVLSDSAWIHMAVRSDWPMLARVMSRLVSGDRLGLGAALIFDTAEFSGGSVLLRPVALDGAEMAALERLMLLRVGAVRGLRSLNDFGETSGHAGIAADFTRLVSMALGVPTQVVPFDSVAAMIDGARNGLVDAIPLLTRTPTREADFEFSRPYFELPYLLVARTDGPLYWSLSSLSGRRVALARAHPLIPILRERHPEIEIVEVPTGQQALAAVADGRAEAAVEIKLFAHQIIQATYPNELRIIEPVRELPAQFAFAVPREKAELVPMIDRALAAVPPSEAARIEQRWVAVDLEPELRLRRYLNIVAPTALALAAVLLTIGLWNRRLATETRARRASEQRLFDMTDRLSAGVYQYRRQPDGEIELLFANQSMRRLFDIASGTTRLSERHLVARIDESERPRIVESWLNAHQRVTPYSQVYKCAFPDGRRGWIASDASPRRTEDGDVLWSGHIVDLTRERETQEELRVLLQSKDLFVATASHELKSPLHGISLALQWLRDHVAPPEERRTIQRALDETVNLGALIDDLLDLSQIATGRLVLRRQPVDLATLLKAIVESFEPVRASKGLSLVLDLPPDVPARVLADPMRLRQIVVNLLGNAFKYTTKGSIRLEVRHGASDDGAREELEFAVSDTGAGIEAERIERIFEPFAVQSERPPEPPSGIAVGTASTGLGLSICRRLVELMGGRIHIASSPGLGTVVRFWIGVEAVEPAAPASAERAPEPLPGAVPSDAGDPRRRLLLVDDDRFGRSMIAMLLEQHGFQVVQAEDGEHAIEIWHTGAFGAVISDLHMPGMSGNELVRQLRELSRADGREPATRFIALSASTGLVSPLDANGDALFDHILEKPIAVERLLECLQPAAAPQATPAPDPSRHSPFRQA